MSIKKESIAVYNPSDPIERVVQEQYHQASGEWLSAFECQLITKGITSLKSTTAWLDNYSLLQQRIGYFFAPFMSHKKNLVVLPTYPLFLRDILENCCISAYLHDPVAFVSRPLAHYLFREYPVHLYFDSSQLKGCNSIKWIDKGGLLITDDDVHFEAECLVQVVTKNEQVNDLVDEIMTDVRNNVTMPLAKVAVSQVSRGVFTIDQHERVIYPESVVWDKVLREYGFVREVEPGEMGFVQIEYENNPEVTIPKQEFDTRFVLGDQYDN